MSITLETKCWESDYRKVLAPGHLSLLAERNQIEFDERVVFINNVLNYEHATAMALAARDRGDCTKIIVVKDHADAALKYFQLTTDDLGRGYVYSISELVSIFLCKTDYLLHFASDCIPTETTDWVAQAIVLLEDNPEIKVANLAWDITGAQHESNNTVIGDFFIGMGFSDQCYLIHAPTFREDIFRESHPASRRYPRYGGELFEKRVDSWMHNHSYRRASYRHSIYHHYRDWHNSESIWISVGQRLDLFEQRVPSTIPGGMVQSKLIIRQAIYGPAGDSFRSRDRTAQVQSLVNQGAVEFEVGRLAWVDDPAYGVVKTLTVVYSINGQERTVIATDPETITLRE